MRRLFIIRKDLNLSDGKLAAMVGHCAEAYWLRLIQNGLQTNVCDDNCCISFTIPNDIMDGYVNDAIVKTICEAKNLNHLKKVEVAAKELGFIEDLDYGYINDKCLTELQAENEDGTCTVGVWFKPLDDDVAHKLSKKYQLYKRKG